jgi:uncharacterized protein (TIGR02145 family)
MDNKFKYILIILIFNLNFCIEITRVYSKVTDIDGNIYKTVIIGTQEWMSENLRVEHYRNGDIIPQIQDAKEWENLKTGAWCYYENLSGNDTVYGKLYNWYAVTDTRGLAPAGCHIPGIDEWSLLFNYLGGEKIAGEKLKAVSDLWYKNPYEVGTNESGFTALPSGCRVYDGWFYLAGIKCCIWTSSYPVEDKAISIELIFQSKSITIYYEDKRGGLSVRCIKD